MRHVGLVFHVRYTYHTVSNSASLSIVAATMAPKDGGFEYMGRIMLLSWERTLCVSAELFVVMDNVPTLWPNGGCETCMTNLHLHHQPTIETKILGQRLRYQDTFVLILLHNTSECSHVCIWIPRRESLVSKVKEWNMSLCLINSPSSVFRCSTQHDTICCCCSPSEPAKFDAIRLL
jgi:hypothetical protein